MNIKPFKTKRLFIRPIVERDYLVWKSALESIKPRQRRHDIGHFAKHHLTQKAHLKRVRRNTALAKKDVMYILHLFHRRTGAYIGTVDIFIVERVDVQSANLGYYILNNHWRQGYAEEALRGVIPRAFRQLNLHRLQAVIDLDNRASRALMRKVGMTYEGIRPKYFYQNDAWEDQVIYSMHAEAFLRKAPKPKIKTSLTDYLK